MPQELVTLARFFDPMAAQLVKIKLEGERIPAELLGDTSSGVFAGLGGAFGTIEVRVPRQQLKQARKLLEDMEDQLEGDEPDVETGIADRDSVRKKPVSGNAPATEDPDKAIAAQLQPRRKPRASDHDSQRTVAWTPDDLADRAWRAAVLGLFFFPIAMYAVWLLLRLGVMDGNLSPAGMRKLYGTLAILGLFALACWSFLSMVQS